MTGLIPADFLRIWPDDSSEILPKRVIVLKLGLRQSLSQSLLESLTLLNLNHGPNIASEMIDSFRLQYFNKNKDISYQD